MRVSHHIIFIGGANNEESNKPTTNEVNTLLVGGFHLNDFEF